MAAAFCDLPTGKLSGRSLGALQHKNEIKSSLSITGCDTWAMNWGAFCSFAFHTPALCLWKIKS